MRKRASSEPFDNNFLGFFSRYIVETEIESGSSFSASRRARVFSVFSILFLFFLHFSFVFFSLFSVFYHRRKRTHVLLPRPLLKEEMEGVQEEMQKEQMFYPPLLFLFFFRQRSRPTVLLLLSLGSFS
jgi:hypothetical protein